VAILSVREVACTLCQERFLLLLPDFIPPQPRICDRCITEAWSKPDPILREWVAEQLGDRVPTGDLSPETSHQEDALEEEVVCHIEALKEVWPSVEALLEQRSLFRRAAGG